MEREVERKRGYACMRFNSISHHCTGHNAYVRFQTNSIQLKKSEKGETRKRDAIRFGSCHIGQKAYKMQKTISCQNWISLISWFMKCDGRFIDIKINSASSTHGKWDRICIRKKNRTCWLLTPLWSRKWKNCCIDCCSPRWFIYLKYIFLFLGPFTSRRTAQTGVFAMLLNQSIVCVGGKRNEMLISMCFICVLCRRHIHFINIYVWCR